MSPFPLQVPGIPELLIIVLLLAVAFGLVGRWVYTDAKFRGSDWAWQWGVGVGSSLLLGLVPGLLGTTVYKSVRGEREETAA